MKEIRYIIQYGYKTSEIEPEIGKCLQIGDSVNLGEFFEDENKVRKVGERVLHYNAKTIYIKLTL